METIHEVGTEVYLLHPNSPQTMHIAECEMINGQAFYRMREVPGALFLSSSFTTDIFVHHAMKDKIDAGFGGTAQDSCMTQSYERRPKTEQERLFDRLHTEANKADQDAALRHRVLHIMHNHPEFLEFLEVLRSGLV